MSEFEMEVSMDIIKHAFNQSTSSHEISQEELVNNYWQDYINSCEMKIPENNFEIIQ